MLTWPAARAYSYDRWLSSIPYDVIFPYPTMFFLPITYNEAFLLRPRVAAGAEAEVEADPVVGAGNDGSGSDGGGWSGDFVFASTLSGSSSSFPPTTARHIIAVHVWEDEVGGSQARDGDDAEEVVAVGAAAASAAGAASARWGRAVRTISIQPEWKPDSKQCD